MKTAAIYSRKGGVGKTTASVNLAAGLAAQGWRVLLVDFDPQGAATWYLRVDRDHGSAKKRWNAKKTDARIVASDYPRLDLLPADVGLAEAEADLAAVAQVKGNGKGNGKDKKSEKKSRTRLAKLLAPLADEYDVCLIDCPPAAGRVGSAIVAASDLIATPVVPTWLARRMLDDLHADIGHQRLWPFACLVSRRGPQREQLTELRASTLPLAQTTIPVCTQVEQMGRHRQPVAAFAPRSPGARAFKKLTAELAAALALPPVTPNAP